MNHKLLILICILITLLTSFSVVLFDYFVEVGTANKVKSAYKHASKRVLDLVTSSLRQSLLSGDIRYVKYKLETEIEKEVLGGYTISRSDGEVVLQSSPQKFHDNITIKKHIYFKNGGVHWGWIEYHLSSSVYDPLQGSLGNRLQVRLLGSFIIILTLLLLFSLFLIKRAKGLQKKLLLCAELGSPLSFGEDLDTLFWRPIIKELTIQNEKAKLYRKKISDMEKLTAIGNMMQKIAHDIRKPLSLVKVMLDIISKCNSIEHLKMTLPDLLVEVDKANTSIQGLLTDVMEFRNTKKFVLNKKIINFNNLILSSLENIAILYPKKDLKVKYSTKSNFFLNIDRNRIMRSLINIIDNAVQKAKDGSEISIEIESYDNSFIVIKVTNYGTVIPEKDRQNIFKTFYTAGKEGGTGLGLAIAKQWVLAHGGNIWCDSGLSSIWPSGYVTFSFLLPYTAPCQSFNRIEYECKLKDFLPSIFKFEPTHSVSNQSDTY